jgi:hypothetical protein
MPTERPGVLTKIKVEQKITIRAIERKRVDADRPWVTVRVWLECAVLLDRGEADPRLLKAFDRQDAGTVTVIERVNGAAVLEACPNLAFPDADESAGIYSDMLERFIRLGTTPEIAAKIEDLSDDPEQKPVVLQSGALAELLQVGLLSVETWTFVLNHGGPRSTSTFILNRGDPSKSTIRHHDVPLRPDVQRRRIQRAIDSCRRAAKALRKVQLMDMTEPLAALGNLQRIELVDPADPLSEVKPVAVRRVDAPGFGSHPGLASGRTATLIADLELVAGQLEGFLSPLSRSPGAPTKAFATEFCREWYDLANERSGHPLYEQGAALYALVFGGKPNPASFESLCRRARRANKNPSVNLN